MTGVDWFLIVILILCFIGKSDKGRSRTYTRKKPTSLPPSERKKSM